jgi:hypothetical protein
VLTFKVVGPFVSSSVSLSVHVDMSDWG